MRSNPKLYTRVIGRSEIILVYSCLFKGSYLYTVCTIFSLLIIYQNHELLKNLNLTLKPNFRDFSSRGKNIVALFIPLIFLSLENNFKISQSPFLDQSASHI